MFKFRAWSLLLQSHYWKIINALERHNSDSFLCIVFHGAVAVHLASFFLHIYGKPHTHFFFALHFDVDKNTGFLSGHALRPFLILNLIRFNRYKSPTQTTTTTKKKKQYKLKKNSKYCRWKKKKNKWYEKQNKLKSKTFWYCVGWV